jgi:hypothetical protein
MTPRYVKQKMFETKRNERARQDRDLACRGDKSRAYYSRQQWSIPSRYAFVQGKRGVVTLGSRDMSQEDKLDCYCGIQRVYILLRYNY